MTNTMQLNRRSALLALGVGAVAASIGNRPGRASAQRPVSFQAGSLDSGALGLRRDEIDELFGPGELVQENLDSTIYAHGAQVGMIYIGYRPSSDPEIATYVEVSFGSQAYPHDKTEQLIATLIPTDAEYAETYLAPATPSGPTAIRTYHFQSESLGTIPGLMPDFVVMRMQERAEDNAWVVRSIHITVADIPQ